MEGGFQGCSIFMAIHRCLEGQGCLLKQTNRAWLTKLIEQVVNEVEPSFRGNGKIPGESECKSLKDPISLINYVDAALSICLPFNN